jgi:periplasmic protein TonB
MSRHVYHPPKGRFTGVYTVIGGLLATVLVFVAVPLSQKLSEVFESSSPPPPDLVIEPPEELDFEVEEPPPEAEEEPEPEEMVEEASDLDLGLEIADLAGGAGGGFVMEIPKFGLRGGEDPFGSGDLDGPPVPTSKPPTVYPAALLGKGIGGRVIVTCAVDEKGEVVSSQIKQSSGHAELDRAALSAVSRWKFKPGTKGGRPVKATCNVPFHFEVKR